MVVIHLHSHLATVTEADARYSLRHRSIKCEIIRE